MTASLSNSAEPLHLDGVLDLNWNFTDPGLFELLEAADDVTLDRAPFGVVAMTKDGVVTSYNAAECEWRSNSPHL
jgi:hypothetical protein